jgi:hypothetical protein
LHEFTQICLKEYAHPVAGRMTKEEFIAKQQAMNSRMKKRSGCLAGFLFAGMVACIPLVNYIDHHEEEYRWIGAVFGIGVLVLLVGSIGLAIAYALREQGRFGHRCPHCKKALVGISAQLAIASGNCGSVATGCLAMRVLE